MQWQAGSSGGGAPPVDSLQTSGRDGARREAPLDARDMMMRGDDSASSGSIFSRLKIGEELTKVKNMTQAGVGKVVQTLGIKKKDGEDPPKAGGTSYDPPSLGDISSNYVRMPGFGGGKASGSASSAQASSSGTPGKLALPAGNSQAVMGGTDDGGSQLRCYNCTVIMSYPPGATKVKCPTCESINATAAPGSSPAPSSSNNISVSCSGCHQPTICPSTTKRLECPHCSAPNTIITCDNSRCNAIISTCEGTPVMSCPACTKIHQLRSQAGPAPPLHVTCVKCQTRLQMPGDAPAVRCPKCAQVTNRSDPRARAQPVAQSQAPTSVPAPSSERRGVSFAPDLQRTAEEKAIEEAIRRSLGEPAPQARPVAGRMNQRREQEAAAGGGEPDEDQLLNMLTSFADITGCELSVAQEYLQANGWRMEVAINNYLNRSTSTSASTGGNGGNSSMNAETNSGAGSGLQGQAPAEALLFDFAALAQPAPDLSQIAPTRPPPQPATPADPFGFASAATSAAVSAASHKVSTDAAPRPTSEEVEPKQRETIEWLGLEEWLSDMGLEKYIETLKSQELTDPDALREVTDEDLKEMEVGTIGARRKILAAIRRLNEAEVVVRSNPASAGHTINPEAVNLDVPAQKDIGVAEIRADGDIQAGGDMHSCEDFSGKPIISKGEMSVDGELLSKPILSEGGIAAEGVIAAGAMVSDPILSGGHITADEVVSDPILAGGQITADEVVSQPVISSEVAGVSAQVEGKEDDCD